MNIPFYPNTLDGTHCWQAALKMLLGTFEPEKEFSYKELDRVTAKPSGKWTWPTAGMLWLLERGYELVLIEDFDYQELASRGEDYIIEKLGKEVGRAQIDNSDVVQELDFARRFSQQHAVDVHLPTKSDIERLMASGYVIICNVNAARLYGQKGYSGHFIVLCGINQNGVTIHDPGLPPQKALTLSWETFEAAWAYPTDREKNLLAVRKKSR